MKKASLVILLCFALAAPAVQSAPAIRPPDDDFTIAAVGDIMLGHRAGPYLERYGPDYPFGSVMPVLREADIVAGNLECPISDRGMAVENKKFTLRAGPLAAQALKEAGIRVVALANNHTMDFGPLALQDTIKMLSENDILYTGAGMGLRDARLPAIVKIKGKAAAFLSYSLTFPLEFYASTSRPGTAPGYAEYVKADIQKARQRADIVIVSFHWGAELMPAAKDYQVEIGRSAIEWGADAVIGSHPHVLQELEIYKGGIIAYSLGNFVFGSESDRTNTSIILLLTFKSNRLARVEAVPIDVNNYRVRYRPKLMKGRRAAEVLDGLNAASERFNTRLGRSGDRGVVLLNASPLSAGFSPGTP